MVEDGRLSAGHARALLPLNAKMQQSAAETVVKAGLSVRQTELLVKKLTLDPALIANPAISSISDTVALTIYFAMASLFLGL